ncbi:MAG: DMT family transporter [Bacillota bacterium]
MSVYYYILIAITVGIAGGLQAIINSNLNKVASLPLTTLVVNLVAFLTILPVYLFFSRQHFGVLREADWFAYLGGILGVVVVMGSTFLIPRTGVAIASSIIIVSQLAFAMVADHFGLFGIREIPVSLAKIAGLGLMIAGIYLFFYRTPVS